VIDASDGLALLHPRSHRSEIEAMPVTFFDLHCKLEGCVKKLAASV